MCPSGDGGGETEYRGLLGAFPAAFRATDSRLAKSYVVVGGLLALFVLLFFLVGVIRAFEQTMAAPGGTFTFSRAFVLVVGVVVGVPVIAPILLVARRHRRTGSSRTYDRALAATGYLYAASLYLLLVISAPPELREAPPPAIAPLVEALYALPAPAGVVPPIAAVLLMFVAHRQYRRESVES